MLCSGSAGICKTVYSQIVSNWQTLAIIEMFICSKMDKLWYRHTVKCYTSMKIYKLQLYTLTEGNGNPLQYSCLENPMDGGTWKAAVHGVAEGRTWLSDFHFHFSLSCIGEGIGNPLQCSCLENPRNGGAWWAAVCGVTQSWTWLKWLSSSRHFLKNNVE